MYYSRWYREEGEGGEEEVAARYVCTQREHTRSECPLSSEDRYTIFGTRNPCH